MLIPQERIYLLPKQIEQTPIDIKYNEIEAVKTSILDTEIEIKDKYKLMWLEARRIGNQRILQYSIVPMDYPTNLQTDVIRE